MSKRSKKSKGRGWEEETSDAIRARLPGEGEVFGVVMQILGAGILLVRCLDGNMRQVRIPGKFRKRMWCRMGDLIVVMPLYGMNPDEKGELVYRYKTNEVSWLIKNGYVPEDFVN
ncbi:MAG: translation initiation factor eIF-1A [Candidatus Heimdallarchaeaceae archaeon]